MSVTSVVALANLAAFPSHNSTRAAEVGGLMATPLLPVGNKLPGLIEACEIASAEIIGGVGKPQRVHS